jgi:hypothetical protein
VEPLDADYVCKLLLKAEQGIHRAGWDQEAFLATLEMPRPTLIGLKEVPIPILDPPGEYIEYLGQQFLADHELGQFIAKEIGQPFVGFALVTEAWSLEQTPEEAEARYASGCMLADTPGAKEVRNICAVDVWGRIFFVYRVRGEKPEAFGGSPEHNLKGLAEVSGRVAQGMLNMTLGTARQMPWLADILIDLETRFVPTVEESFAAQKERRARDVSPNE